jgi:hypothetical protein
MSVVRVTIAAPPCARRGGSKGLRSSSKYTMAATAPVVNACINQSDQANWRYQCIRDARVANGSSRHTARSNGTGIEASLDASRIRKTSTSLMDPSTSFETAAKTAPASTASRRRSAAAPTTETAGEDSVVTVAGVPASPQNIQLEKLLPDGSGIRRFRGCAANVTEVTNSLRIYSAGSEGLRWSLRGRRWGGVVSLG